jgi:hypothetical protein
MLGFGLFSSGVRDLAHKHAPPLLDCGRAGRGEGRVVVVCVCAGVTGKRTTGLSV